MWYRFGNQYQTTPTFESDCFELEPASSSSPLYLTAVRRLAIEAADNGVLSSEVAAAIGRVKGLKREGVRIGNWLSAAESESFISLPDVHTLKGKRDRALLAILIGVRNNGTRAGAEVAQFVCSAAAIASRPSGEGVERIRTRDAATRRDQDSVVRARQGCPVLLRFRSARLGRRAGPVQGPGRGLLTRYPRYRRFRTGQIAGSL